MNKLLVLIQCKNEVGLVINITRVLASHNLNIIAMWESYEKKGTNMIDKQLARL